MYINTVIGILIPFLGTSLGAAMVFVLKERVKNNLYFWAHLYKGSQDP